MSNQLRRELNCRKEGRRQRKVEPLLRLQKNVKLFARRTESFTVLISSGYFANYCTKGDATPLFFSSAFQ